MGVLDLKYDLNFLLTIDMGFVFFVVLISAFFWQQGISGQTWQRLSPDLYDVQWIDEGTAVACGGYGLLFRSQDRGASWEMQKTGAYHTLRNMYWFDDQSGVVVGDSGAVFYSDNGGNEWIPSIIETGSSIYDVAFNSRGIGYVATLDSILYRTENQGQTWEVSNSSLPDRFGRICFVNDSTLCALNLGKGKIYWSNDMGVSWNLVYQDSTYEFRDLAFSGSRGIVAGGGTRTNAKAEERPLILRSEDNGLTWEQQPLNGVDFELMSIGMDFGGDNLIAGGRVSTTSFEEKIYHRVIRSEDGGQTWTLHAVDSMPSILSFLSVSINSQKLGIVVGTMQGIYLTNDGGKEWETRSFSRVHDFSNSSIHQTYITGVSSLRKDVLVAYGQGQLTSSGMYILSNDNGVTWATGFLLDQIVGAEFIEDNFGIGIPRATSRNDSPGKIYLVRDEGGSWIRNSALFDEEYDYKTTSPPIVYEGDFYFAADSLLFGSFDQGVNWKKVSSISDVALVSELQILHSKWIASVTRNPVFINDTTVVITRELLKSEDMGKTWMTMASTGDFDSAYSFVRFKSDSLGFYGAFSGDLFRTDDGGESWSRVGLFRGSCNDMAFLTDSLFYAVGSNGLILCSKDAGATWSDENALPPLNAPPSFSAIELDITGTTLFVTGAGVIMRGDFPEPVTSVSERKKEYGQNMSLMVRPNPVSGDKLQIYLSGVAGSSADIELYDVSGRLLKSQTVDTRDPQGTWVSLDVDDIIPGAYRVVVQNGEQQTSAAVTILR